jgi:1,4-alpha-glucan branching enzyme
MRRAHEPQYGPSLLTDHDIYLFKEGNHFDLSDKLGSHPMTVDGESGTRFDLLAPNAHSVSWSGT